MAHVNILLVYPQILTVTTLAIPFLLPLLFYHGDLGMSGYEQIFAALPSAWPT